MACNKNIEKRHIMAGILKEIINNPNVEIQRRDHEKTVYMIKCKEGWGKMTEFQVFDGIEIVYNDFHTTYCFQTDIPIPNVMEINYCNKGRFECEFKKDLYVYLGEGDLSVNMLQCQTKHSRFPLVLYKGITILIDLPKASNILSNQLIKGVTVNLLMLKERLCPKDGYRVFKAPENIEHIFKEMYAADHKIISGYIRLKVLELLMVLNVLDLPDELDKTQYFSSKQVQKVKEIREYLTTHLSKNITLQELSDKNQISLTAMKNCFKATYGKTIYAFRREYRMQAAAKMLQETFYTISDIAGKVGYENPGKFSSAFKEIMGITPGAYRRK